MYAHILRYLNCEYKMWAITSKWESNIEKLYEQVSPLICIITSLIGRWINAPKPTDLHVWKILLESFCSQKSHIGLFTGWNLRPVETKR